MITEETRKKLQFSELTLETKSIYKKYFPDKYLRGCELSFANLLSWGKHSYAISDGYFIIFSRYGKFHTYHYPIGNGDIKNAIESIILDAGERNVPLRISGISQEAKGELEKYFPDKFIFQYNENSFDYVYNIDDLADLEGKKYHAKRNHINRFTEAHPDYKIVPVTKDNIGEIHKMSSLWYKTKMEENPDGDYDMEHKALETVLKNYENLGMDGIAITDNGEILAFTIGSLFTEEMFDVQFEKARSDIQGAYAVVNRDFARYLRKKYKGLNYLDREEDMGIEGLRKAKKSYYPCGRIEKYRAVQESGNDNK